MDFDGIIGQEDIVKGLKDSIKSGRVGHAYIFSGQKGLGKKTIAETFAGALLCEKQYGDRICGECLPCRMLKEGSNPDFFVAGTADETINVDEIRNLQSDTIIRPLYSARKVYLIPDADNMTIQAQNSLLKIFEEPPAYTVIILTTSNYDALIETIRSRAVRYSFKKYSSGEIEKVMNKKFMPDPGKIDLIISYSDGILGTALKLAGSDEFVEIRNKTIEMLFKINNSKLSDVFGIYTYFEENKSNIGVILDTMLLVYRDLLVLRKACKENILINSDKKDIILSNVEKFSAAKLIRNIEQIENTRRNIDINANYQLSIEVMLMKLREE